MVVHGWRVGLTCGIYEIVNTVNGKRYVGSSVDIEGRFRNHLWRLGRGDHHSIVLQRAWNKYGADAFNFTILMECDECDILDYEQIEIDTKSEYNIAPTAGSNRGHRWTDEQKKEQSNTQIQYYIDNPEAREKMSIAATKSHSRPEVREAISKGTIEGLSCPEARAKRSRYMVKQWEDDEYREMMCAMSKRNINRPEHMAKIIEVNTGRNNSQYNHTVYNFYHEDHGEITCTQNDLRKKYNLRSSNLSQVCSGGKGSHMGWKVKRDA